MSWSRKILTGALYLALLSFSNGLLAEDKPSNPDPKQAMTSLLRQLKSFQASFTQKLMSEADTNELIAYAKGKVALQKPKQLRWEVDSKDKLLIVADGKQVFEYDPDLQQVFIQTFEGKQDSPFLFLSEENPDLSQFKVVSLEKTVCDARSTACFELQTLEKGGAFQWIRLGWDKAGPTELEFLDEMGQHGWIIFRNRQFNRPIPPQTFTFTVPKGVDIVKR